jgi:carbon monoxide dehydrogenase subunit G
MKIEGTQEVRASRERVFQALLDPEVLQRCIPGVERLEQSGENAYAVTLRAGVGSIKGLFTGNVRLEDLQPPAHYRMVIDGKGQPGFLKGTGELDLEEKEALTIVKYAGDAQIGGTIAGVGQRMIQAAAKMMVAQFFAAIEVEAQRDPEDEPPKHGFVRTALRATSKSVRRALQGNKDEEKDESEEAE